MKKLGKCRGLYSRSYYGNYDTNIKAIRGGGVNTPSNPSNRTNTVESISGKWRPEQTPTPPLFKSVYYSEPNLSNGYLNDENYVLETPDAIGQISDYYYPSQKFDDVRIIKNKFDDNLDPNEFQFPPPLITTKPASKSENKKTSSENKKSKSKTKFKNISKDKIKEKRLSQDDMNFIEFIKSNSLYDGKYIYTIENIDLPANSDYEHDNERDTTTRLIYIPYPNIRINEIEGLDPDDDYIENFENSGSEINEQINITNKSQSNSNTILFIIFSILLMIFFSKQQK